MKQAKVVIAGDVLPSLPVRERGLKRAIRIRCCGQITSLPVRERGLKLHARYGIVAGNRVAPRAGAWIETRHGPGHVR